MAQEEGRASLAGAGCGAGILVYAGACFWLWLEATCQSASEELFPKIVAPRYYKIRLHFYVQYKIRLYLCNLPSV